MSAHIDFRTLPANVPVLCIPRVYPNISEGRIRKIFDDLDMGTLERIDIVSKTSEKGEKFNRVFVHFRRWNNSDNANTARERLLNGKEIKIIYDDPWFWKISAYREGERKPQQVPSGGSRKATLAFDSDEEKSSKPVLNRDERRRDDRRPDRRDDRRPDRRDDRRPDRRDDRRRRDDSRERPARRDNSRERPRQDDKPKVLERKFVEPRTPSNSPPRQRPVDESVTTEAPMTINYGNILPPPRRKFGGAKKTNPMDVKPLQIEKEEGEVSDSDAVVENA
jgi:hypothetical protein